MPLPYEPSKEVSIGLTRVTGKPVLKRVIPETDHPAVQRLLARNKLSKGSRYV